MKWRSQLGGAICGAGVGQRRQREIERRAGTETALCPDAPSMALNDALANSKTDPGARVLALSVQSLKCSEDFFRVLLIESDSPITHGYEPFAAVLPGFAILDLGLLGWLAKLNRV